MLSPFVEHKFQARVNKALEKVKTILDNTRNPQYPADVHHEYEDKFILSDFLTTSAIAALLNNLEYLGISEKPLQQLREWAKTKNVTLRLKAEESTKFLRKDTREVESDTKHVWLSLFFAEVFLSFIHFFLFFGVFFKKFKQKKKKKILLIWAFPHD